MAAGGAGSSKAEDSRPEQWQLRPLPLRSGRPPRRDSCGRLRARRRNGGRSGMRRSSIPAAGRSCSSTLNAATAGKQRNTRRRARSGPRELLPPPLLHIGLPAAGIWGRSGRSDSGGDRVRERLRFCALLLDPSPPRPAHVRSISASSSSAPARAVGRRREAPAGGIGEREGREERSAGRESGAERGVGGGSEEGGVSVGAHA
ncbi:unnamed protein product [Urochloa humidicola]